MSVGQFDVRSPLNLSVQLAPADGTGNKTLYAATINGARIDDILISNNDTIAHVLNFLISIGGIISSVASVSVPAGAGVAGAAQVQVGATQLPTQQAGWILAPGTTFLVQAEVAVQAGKVMTLFCQGGTF